MGKQLLLLLIGIVFLSGCINQNTNCETIRNENKRNECYLNLATSTKNMTLCYNIERNKNLSNLCYENFCEEIKSRPACNDTLDYDCKYNDIDIFSSLNGLEWVKSNIQTGSNIINWWDYSKELKVIGGLSPVIMNPSKLALISVSCLQESAVCPCNQKDFEPLESESNFKYIATFFIVNNENDALCIAKKYNSNYVFITKHEIEKYYWLSYFGSYDMDKHTGDGRNYIYFHFSGFDQSGFLTYKNDQTPLTITLLERNNTQMAVANYPQQGIRNWIIKDIMYFQDGEAVSKSYNSEINTLDGLLWVDPNFQIAIFMESDVRDSIFTNMFFFNGEGDIEFGIEPLKKFRMIYSSPEVKIFELNFDDINCSV